MSNRVRRNLEEAAGISVFLLIAGVFIWLGKAHAAAPTRHDATEYTTLSCKMSSKKDCLEKLQLLGADGWQTGAATFDNRVDETTFWLQRKK